MKLPEKKNNKKKGLKKGKKNGPENKNKKELIWIKSNWVF